MASYLHPYSPMELTSRSRRRQEAPASECLGFALFCGEDQTGGLRVVGSMRWGDGGAPACEVPNTQGSRARLECSPSGEQSRPVVRLADEVIQQREQQLPPPLVPFLKELLGERSIRAHGAGDGLHGRPGNPLSSRYPLRTWLVSHSGVLVWWVRWLPTPMPRHSGFDLRSASLRPPSVGPHLSVIGSSAGGRVSDGGYGAATGSPGGVMDVVGGVCRRWDACERRPTATIPSYPLRRPSRRGEARREPDLVDHRG